MAKDLLSLWITLTEGIEMIDTLGYTKSLEKAGLSREQAEIFVRGQLQMISDNVVTKPDFLTMKADLQGMRSELQSEIQGLRGELQREVQDIRAGLDKLEIGFNLKLQQMTNRLGVIVIGSATILGILLGFAT